MTFDLKDYRSALGSFATGVTIVTTLDSNGNGHGLTVNSFASVSLEPPLVLWCLGNKSDSFDLFSKCDAYAINVLADNQGDLAMRFAGKGDQKLAAGEYGALQTGSPILPGTIAAFDAEVVQRIEAGDHLILLGQTKAYQRHDGQGLAYFRGQFGSTTALAKS
ncbi:flavin reductase family protein [Aquidulcibacter paucihalophilus]|uniref:flavin reductase family protein n=1 Tax=Aquidulcibacter paucihalophilus TaxID=1978549 RepID=UPI000A18B390|nr:flavin reductase family protein [Aquidulcibacter paucihalophilus]